MKNLIYVSILMLFMLFGCGGGGGSSTSGASAGGAGAKGPFVNGSAVTAYKLETNGTRSTTSVSTTTNDSLGHYSLSGITWSGATEIVITGRYFNENSGSTSALPATLSAIVSVTSGSALTANVNVLTDLEAQRIKALMLAGTTLATAKSQAKSAVVNLFGLTLPSGTDLEDLDLTQGSGANARANADLLRISAAIAQNPSVLSDLERAIADGNVTNDSNGSATFATLAQAVNDVNLTQVSQNLEHNLSVSDAPDENDTDANASFASNEYVPVIASISNVTIDEDSTPNTVSISVSDGDGDSITLSASSSDESLATVSISGTTLTITPQANANGSATITVNAYDGLYTSTKEFTLTVNPINGAPVLANISNVTKTEDSPAFTVELNATDIDGDSITYSATSSDTNKAAVSISGSTLTITPVANANGDVDINVTANDGQGSSDSKSFTLTINLVNDAPVLANIADQEIDEDSSSDITILLNATDVDGDSITYSVSSNPSIAAVQILSGGGNYYVNISTITNKNGTATVTVTASDGNGGSDSKSFTLTINPVNDAPTIISENSKSISENTTAVMTIDADDIDSDSFTFSIDGGDDASKFTIDGTSGALSFKTAPDYENPTDSDGDNIYSVIVKVSDGDGGYDYKDIEVVVTDVVDTLSGNVADGYVRDAHISVYSDREMTNLIGSGDTNSSGDFDVSLNTIPSNNTLYIRSDGGTIIDTGMPAPSMHLIANINNDGIHVTPITSTIYTMVMSGRDQTDAENEVQSSLGISGTTEALYDDPAANANSSLAAAMLRRILSSNTMGTSLPDGNYHVVVSAYNLSDVGSVIHDTSDIISNLITLSVNIQDGVISGSIDGVNSQVTGYVSGLTVAMKILLTDDNKAISIAGNVGIFGSSSGVLSVQDGDTQQQYQGVFSAQFIPQGITPTQTQRIISIMTEIAQIPQSMLLRLYIGNGADMGIADLNTTAVTPDLNLTVENSILTLGSADVQTSGNTQLLEANSSDSRFITLSNGFPSNITVKKYAVHTSSDPSSSVDSTAYVIQAMGVRKAIVVVTDNSNHITSIGDAYISTDGVVAPYLDFGTSYNIYVGVVHGGMVGDTREHMLLQQMIEDSDETEQLQLPDGSGHISTSVRLAPTDPAEDDVWFVNGSTVGLYFDTDSDGLNDEDDYMSSIQLYQSGAFDGEQVNGGMMDSVALKNYPGVFIGYLKEQNQTPIPASGQYSYLARALKVSDPSNGLPISRGTITFSSSGVIMSIDGSNIPLQSTFVNGIYHLEASLGSTYIDIVWPTGGKKALYAISTSSSGDVIEVGEAYITR